MEETGEITNYSGGKREKLVQKLSLFLRKLVKF